MLIGRIDSRQGRVWACPRRCYRRRVRRALVIALLIVGLATVGSSAATAASGPPRVTLIGDSILTAVQWNATALSILGQGVDLQMEVAVCRRLTGESCPYEGGQASTLVDLVAELGPRLGRTVIVGVGYNDFEQSFAQDVEESVAALLEAGVTRILWTTLRAAREPYLNMNDDIREAAERHPEMTVVDWNLYSRSHPDWFQNDGIHLFPAGGVAIATLLHTTFAELATAPTSLAPAPSAVVLVPKPLAVARVGRAYSARLVARGGTAPYRWTVTSGLLPKGLRLYADGRVSGTPTRPGQARLVLRAADAEGLTATRRAVLVVTA